jgi:hypothetical protein
MNVTFLKKRKSIIEGKWQACGRQVAIREGTCTWALEGRNLSVLFHSVPGQGSDMNGELNTHLLI